MIRALFEGYYCGIFTMQEHSLVDYNEYIVIVVDINFKNVYHIQK